MTFTMCEAHSMHEPALLTIMWGHDEVLNKLYTTEAILSIISVHSAIKLGIRNNETLEINK